GEAGGAVGEDVAGECGVGGVQVVAECGARHGVPAAVAGQGDDAFAEPGELEPVGEVEVDLGGFVDGSAGGGGDLDEVEGGVGGHHGGDAFGEVGGDAAGDEGVASFLEGGEVGSGEEFGQVAEESVDALDEEPDVAGEVEGWAPVGEEPPGAAFAEFARFGEHGDLGGGVDLVVEGFDLAVEAGEVEHFAGDEVGAGDFGGGGAGFLADAEHERGAHAVDEVVHDAGDDDL